MAVSIELAKTICEKIQSIHRWSPTLRIMQYCGLDDTPSNRSAVRDTCEALAASGVLRRRGTHKYSWARTENDFNPKNPLRAVGEKHGKKGAMRRVAVKGGTPPVRAGIHGWVEGPNTYDNKDHIRRMGGEWNSKSKRWEACNAHVAKSLSVLCGRVKGIQYIPIDEASEEVDMREEGSVAEMRKELAEMTLRAERLQNEKDDIIEKKEALQKEVDEEVKIIKCIRPDGEEVEIEGVVHREFERVKQLCEARMNVFLFGPTGCGKSHLCEQVANALGLDYAFVSCTSGMSEGQLGGRLLPTGDDGQFNYVVSEFIRCFEEGGLFLLDEIDAADANVLLLVNAALANGRVAVTNRPGKPYAVRHPDFVCIAAANTLGTGADRLYSGRNQLDASTLDRFQIGKVQLEYDERIERALCPDDKLRGHWQCIRRAIEAHGLERAMSTRFIKDSYRMKSKWDWSIPKMEEAFFLGWREDEKAKVLAFND